MYIIITFLPNEVLLVGAFVYEQYEVQGVLLFITCTGASLVQVPGARAGPPSAAQAHDGAQSSITGNIDNDDAQIARIASNYIIHTLSQKEGWTVL